MKIIADTLGPLNPFPFNWQNNLHKIYGNGVVYQLTQEKENDVIKQKKNFEDTICMSKTV